jgi:hypothetical protein
MKMIVRAYSNGFGPDYALIDITPGLGKLIDERIDLVKKFYEEATNGGIFTGLYCLEFWDYHVEYLNYWSGLKEAAEIKDDKALPEDFYDYLVVPDNFEIPEHARIRTECDVMRVTNTNVYWSAYIKYSDPPVEIHVEFEVTQGLITKILEEAGNSDYI